MTTLEILQKIRDIQNNADPKFFNKGIIPSYRKNPFLNKHIPDDNIFFSASLLYILKSLEQHFNPKEKDILSEIYSDIVRNFKYHTNKPERNSYNFWRKEPHKHFPNGNLFNKLNKFILPDDIDTTSLIQLAQTFNYKKAIKTKQSICNHANLENKQITNGHKSLRNLRAYSTWFGINMPIEFDLCVLSNLFLWIHRYNFELNKYDNESLKLIERSISESLYFRSAFLSAPEYPKASIILYHLSRLLCTTNYLKQYQNKLISDITQLYNTTKDQFEILLLSSSLMKLKALPDTNTVKKISLNPEILNRWWFTAGFLSSSSNPIVNKIAPYSIFHYRFYSPAFNLALFLENKLLTKNIDKQVKSVFLP